MYDEILPKYKKAAESRNQMNYYVRGTYTHNNTDFSEDVLHLADEGFEQISVEPVVADKTEDYALRMEDVPKLLAEYDRSADVSISCRLSIFSWMRSDASLAPPVSSMKRSRRSFSLSICCDSSSHSAIRLPMVSPGYASDGWLWSFPFSSTLFLTSPWSCGLNWRQAGR